MLDAGYREHTVARIRPPRALFAPHAWPVLLKEVRRGARDMQAPDNRPTKTMFRLEQTGRRGVASVAPAA
jgi:hypothetical protein